MPNLPHPISGYIYSVNNELVSGATITCGSNSATSDSTGFYMLNVDGETGSSVSITAYKQYEGTKTSSLVLTDAPQTLDLTLEQTSSMTHYVTPNNRYELKFSMLTDFEGNKITKSNPLPVSSSEIDLTLNPSHSWSYTRSDGQPDYEEVTLQGVTYRRTFTYTSEGFLSARSAWVRQ